MSAFVIRDVIHSDIEFDFNIKQILDCKEFQRLQRIHQLSCEYLVFPTATHTRFAHSIGTYHIMKKLIAHFTQILENQGYTVNDDDKNLAYVAALLHDIGHGAFSHTFEKIFKLKEHEQWGLDIIKDESTTVHQKIIQIYGKDFMDRLISIISKSYKGEDNPKIFSIIATLVSSQTDADRMDYLLRDSYFTSVTNGRYDVERLIKSFGVKEEKGDLKIYVNEKYMSTLEEYVLARYFMHKEVYQHIVKQHMEMCLVLIMKRARELIQDGENIYCDDVLKKLILHEDITVEEYLRTDDTYFIYHIANWSRHKDDVLSYLCHCFVNRETFDIEYDCDDDGKEFEKEITDKINQILKINNKKLIDDISQEYFYIKTTKKAGLYVNTGENIWIKSKGSNKLQDLSKKSLLINSSNASKVFKSSHIFISSKLFEEKYNIKLDVKM